MNENNNFDSTTGQSLNSTIPVQLVVPENVQQAEINPIPVTPVPSIEIQPIQPIDQLPTIEVKEEKREERKIGINYAFMIVLFIILFGAIFFLFPILFKTL